MILKSKCLYSEKIWSWCIPSLNFFLLQHSFTPIHHLWSFMFKSCFGLLKKIQNKLFVGFFLYMLSFLTDVMADKVPTTDNYFIKHPFKIKQTYPITVHKLSTKSLSRALLRCDVLNNSCLYVQILSNTLEYAEEEKKSIG